MTGGSGSSSTSGDSSEFHKSFYGHFIYDDTLPAYVHPGRIPQVYMGGRWKPMYDSQSFYHNAERTSQSHWEQLLKDHGAYLPEGA